MAGGYDERVVENREHYLELRQISQKLGLENRVTYLRSFSDADKRLLLTKSTCLIYTPDKEHFGIVPVEAMYLQCPVIAVKSGGPLETVLNGTTGFLCSPDPENFVEAMEKFVKSPVLKDKMGESGRERVIDKFSFSTFSKELNKYIQIVNQSQVSSTNVLLFTLFLIVLLNGFFALFYVYLF